MTFRDKYSESKTWQEKALVMELYHLAMSQRQKGWTLTDTAKEFEVSIGLVSENLKLAHLMHRHPTLSECKSRNEALTKIQHVRI